MSAGLPQEWQQWFYENLARGCQPTQLFETLSAHGFAHQLQQALTDAGQHFPHLRDQFEQMRTWLHPIDQAPNQAPAALPIIIAPHLFAQDQHTVEVAGHQIRLTVQLHSPAILCFEHFLTDQECEALITLAENSGQISRCKIMMACSPSIIAGAANKHGLRVGKRHCLLILKHGLPRYCVTLLSVVKVCKCYVIAMEASTAHILIFLIPSLVAVPNIWQSVVSGWRP